MSLILFAMQVDPRAPWERWIEFFAFYRFALVIAILGGVAGFVLIRKRWPQFLSFFSIFFLAVAFAYCAYTHNISSLAADLSCEDENFVEHFVFPRCRTLSKRELLTGATSSGCSDNAKFYFCLAIRQRLLVGDIPLVQVTNYLKDSSLIHPVFFGRNNLNAEFVQRAICGESFDPLQLVFSQGSVSH
jgi:hypothetical protein